MRKGFPESGTAGEFPPSADQAETGQDGLPRGGGNPQPPMPRANSPAVSKVRENQNYALGSTVRYRAYGALGQALLHGFLP